MPWDQFLIKVLLRKYVCRSREQCMGSIGQLQNAILNQKKKKKPDARRCLNQLYPNAAKEYEAEYGLKVKLFLKPFFPFIFYDPRNYLQ